MVKLNIETIAIVGAIGYLGYAYFTKSFPFDGSLDELLGALPGGGEGAAGGAGTDPAAVDPLTGKIGAAINPAAGAANKTLSELELLAQTKSQYQSLPPLVAGDIQGIGDTSIYSPAIPGAPPATTTTPPAAEEDETEACADWCTGECNKLTGTAKTNCVKACATVCAQGAGAVETEDEDKVTIPVPKVEEEEEEEEEEEAAKPNRSLCSSKFNGKCNTECKSPKSSACKECKQVCGENSAYARSYFAKRAFPAYRDFITPVASERQMLRRGRPRSGFRSYRAVPSEKRSGFDSLYGAGTIKIRRMALSS